MQSSFLTAVMLPLGLAIIMLGLGLSLTWADFRRVGQMPRPVLVGLAVQTLILPAAAFAIAHAFGLTPALAVGLVLLAASPGGPTANLFSHLAGGDVALNITLTATNSLLSVVTLPAMLALGMAHFMGQDRQIPLQFGKIVSVMAIVIVPVAIGMAIARARPALARSLERPVKIASAVFLALIIAGTAMQERAHLGELFAQVGVPALVFNLVSLGAGFSLPRLLNLPDRQATAIALEVGIHNGTLAIAVANTVLQDSTIAVPAAIYSLIMFGTGSAFATWARRRNQAPALVAVPA